MGNILNPGNDNSFIRLVKFKDSEIFVDNCTSAIHFEATKPYKQRI